MKCLTEGKLTKKVKWKVQLICTTVSITSFLAIDYKVKYQLSEKS